MEASVESSILKSVEPEEVNSEVIFRRISSPYYISSGHTIGEVAELLISDNTINAIGVEDDDGKAAGIVVRNELFSLIGQKFGRELYLNRGIKEVMLTPQSIYYKRNTYSVIDEVADELRSEFNRFYMLVDAGNFFKGVVSSFDLVLFLSDMMTKELRAARRIHSAIVMDRICIMEERFEAEGATVMAGETGGDFQFIRKIDENRWFTSLCDVSGKGLNAGLISVAVSSMYAVYDFSRGIGELVSRINSYIYDLFEGELFLTGVFFEFNDATGEMSFYDMGHSMFYIIRDGKARKLSGDKENIPLGVLKGNPPVRSTVKLQPGDLIVLYTDGFPEQCDAANRCFGENRLLSLVMKYRNAGLQGIKEILYDELKAWRVGNAQGDDMSLLLLRFR